MWMKQRGRTPLLRRRNMFSTGNPLDCVVSCKIAADTDTHVHTHTFYGLASSSSSPHLSLSLCRGVRGLSVSAHHSSVRSASQPGRLCWISTLSVCVKRRRKKKRKGRFICFPSTARLSSGVGRGTDTIAGFLFVCLHLSSVAEPEHVACLTPWTYACFSSASPAVYTTLLEGRRSGCSL